MINEFAAEYRRRLDAAGAEQYGGFRASKDMDDVRKRQGALDGIDVARGVFDDMIKNWTGDDDAE